MAVTFGLFGTLVRTSGPEDPAAAVASALGDRGVDVPDDWAAVYGEPHVRAPPGAAVPLPAHVAAALASRGVDAPGNAARRAVVSAFDHEVTTRTGAADAVAAAAHHGPVGVVANCRVPELARRTLVRSSVDRAHLDSVVTSAACGWRKPHPRAFEAVAGRLGTDVADLVHVGGDPVADGGAADAGATTLLVDAGATDAGATRAPVAERPATTAPDDGSAAPADEAAATTSRDDGATIADEAAAPVEAVPLAAVPDRLSVLTGDP